jgi:ABC-type transport system substrate-binding protein
MRAMFEGLVGFDLDFNLVPELATDWTSPPTPPSSSSPCATA